MTFKNYYLCLVLSMIATGCSSADEESVSDVVFTSGAYPHATEYGGKFYFTMQASQGDTITIYTSDNLMELPRAQRKTVLTTAESGLHNIYSPELHHIGEKWYIYFEGDNGNTDNHQIYVLENPSANPMQGEWTLHDPIITNSECNFGLHPSTFLIGKKQYLLWSGWQQQRVENETQCIFIAEMETPTTLKTNRVILSMPQYEWERQWINPDGSRSAYPIFVNENPEAIISPDGSHVVVVYSASGIWTEFNSLGLLYAPIESNLLDPKSWTKLPEPQFVAEEGSGLFGTSNISVISTPDKRRQYMFYQAKHRTPDNGVCSDVRLKEISWTEHGLPVFGKP